MGLVEDCDIVGQGLEAYHGHRVASVVAQGKMLNGLGSDISVATAPSDQKHLQILKMFGRPRCTAATGQGADTEKICRNHENMAS